MKIIFIPAGLLIFFSLPTYAQEDSVTFIKTPTLTEIGRPVGEKISQKMNKDGGRLLSPDGRMELIIPPGALSSKTNISIQPVTNVAPGGRGNSYKLEPAGIQFSQPAQIIFHYNQNDFDGSMEALQGISFQDEKGQWYRLKNAALDTINKTISGNITHFSIWATFDYSEIRPAVSRVKVGKKIPLTIVINYPPGDPSAQSNGAADDDLLAGPGNIVHINPTWKVNGVTGGNSIVGTIIPLQGNSETFTAPGSVPDRNPVDVTAEANANLTINGVTFHSLKLVSHITIIDNSYEITVIGYNQQNILQCTISSIDSSTCILQLNSDRSKIQDIQNMNFKITVTGCPCNVRELNPGGNIGPINIVGASRIEVVPANPPQKPYASVTIYFIRNTGTVSGMAIDPCLGQPALSLPAMPFPAMPIVLQFDAKDGEQVLKEGGDEKNGFKVKVKRIEADQ